VPGTAVEVDAFEARDVHQIDHLDGRLFLDRVSSSEAAFRRRSTGRT
jgi:peptide deformylase